MVTRALTLTLVLAGCTDQLTVSPVIDSPTDSDSQAFPDLDEVLLTVAHAGSTQNLVEQSFLRGQPLELAGVPFADDLVIHLSGSIGGSEVAYGRTCTFALTRTDPPPTPHLFFSRSVKFGALPIQSASRNGGHAVTYHDGSALMFGGTVGTPASCAPDDTTCDVLDVEHFDPRTGTLDVLTSTMPRKGVVSAPLGVNNPPIALIGGDFDTGAGFYEVLEVDGVRIDNFPDTHMERVGLTATALTDGRVIVVGGQAPNTGTTMGPTSGEIDELSAASGAPAVRMLRAVLAHPRHGHTATRLGDDVGAPILIAGGRDDAAAVPVAELFLSLAENLATTFAPSMIFPRSDHHAILMPDGSVLFMGGTTLDVATGNFDKPVTNLELFLRDGGFVDVGVDLAPLGAGIIDFTATTLPDGRILLAGGRATVGGPALDTAFIASLDPVDGSVEVVPTDRLAVPRAGHQATLMCDGTVLISGGTDGPTLVERYNPPELGRR